MRFHRLADEKMSPLNVLDPRMVLEIIGNIDSGLIVYGKRHRGFRAQPELREEGTQVNSLLRGLGGSYYSPVT